MSEDPNRLMARRAQHHTERKVECPSCGVERRKFVIIDGKCDHCRTTEEREAHPGPAAPGWAEVRHKRMLLLEGSDRTQLADRDPNMRERFASWRQALRDITDDTSEEAAWAALAALEEARPPE